MTENHLCPNCHYSVLEEDEGFPDCVVWRCTICEARYSPRQLRAAWLAQGRKNFTNVGPIVSPRRLIIMGLIGFVVTLLILLF